MRLGRWCSAVAETVGFRWTVDSLTPTLRSLDTKAATAITAATRNGASKAQSNMKAAAPWKDETGAARAGLNAQVTQSGPQTWVITLAHGVRYGIFLETRWGGRYEVIRPELQRSGNDVMTLLRGVLAAIKVGR